MVVMFGECFFISGVFFSKVERVCRVVVFVLRRWSLVEEWSVVDSDWIIVDWVVDLRLCVLFCGMMGCFVSEMVVFDELEEGNEDSEDFDYYDGEVNFSRIISIDVGFLFRGVVIDYWLGGK